MAASSSISPAVGRITSAAQLDIVQKGTKSGVWGLGVGEKWWRDRFEFLEERGYVLRPRYRPWWKPSWLGTNLNPFDCEDSKRLLVSHFSTLLRHRCQAISLQSTRWIDAVRTSDGKRIAIKRVQRGSSEIPIACSLSSEGNIDHPDNHCVPILDYFDDIHDNEVGLLVMPLLMPYNRAPFIFIKEVVEFVRQTLRVSLIVSVCPDCALIYPFRVSFSCTNKT